MNNKLKTFCTSLKITHCSYASLHTSHSHIYTCMDKHTRTHTHTDIHTRTCAHTCTAHIDRHTTHTPTHVQTDTHTHRCTHAHTIHSCLLSWILPSSSAEFIRYLSIQPNPTIVIMKHNSGFIIGIAMIFCQNSNRTYTLKPPQKASFSLK